MKKYLKYVIYDILSLWLVKSDVSDQIERYSVLDKLFVSEDWKWTSGCAK